MDPMTWKKEGLIGAWTGARGLRRTCCKRCCSERMCTVRKTNTVVHEFYGKVVVTKISVKAMHSSKVMQVIY